MCGICGFTGARGEARDYATLRAMCTAMAHRGPDGEGLYIADGIALGHRRLSLIDLAGGGQPMVRATDEHVAEVWTTAVSFNHVRGEAAQVVDDATIAHPVTARRGRWSIIFNGEIYNYCELRNELVELGFEFATDSDTEVLLVGYIAWSQEILQRVRGMFAFAIYDADAQELFCARDFFGIKPFYYTVQNGQFVFASEIKSILEHPAYTRELNEEALAQYLCFQFSALPETFFKGVFKLPQGHCLRVGADGIPQIERYWRPEYNFDETRSEADAVKAVDRAMRESVRYHNVADVEVGSFLSSGIDSSYLAACLAKENPAIKTFTVGFAEYSGERDEVSWARELAEKLQVENDFKHISEEEYWEVLPIVQWHMDEPSADPSAVALYFVDKIAARRVKAVLSGEGADEFFGGYRIYQAPLANEHVHLVPKPLLRAGSKVLRAAHQRGANYLERASENVEDWYYTNANTVAFSPEERDHLLSAALRERLADLPTPQQLTAPVYAEVAGLDDTTRMQYVDLWFWLVGDILLKTDKMSMAHSLESRVPFLDREVFALSATIPPSQKVSEHQTKIVLRQAAERAIPHDWAQKEKLGFPVPIVSWLREERYYERIKREFISAEAARFFDTRELVHLLDEHRTGSVDNSRRIWIVYSFLLWYRIFFGK
ncbi:MAG: asparagine synthase (glutamine-hydrolyzing) [Eggerthellaceae bacterium]|nr:asparagine synthase (glutamine-hydrolyzing) [Eggerthellaceae bacterium]